MFHHEEVDKSGNRESEIGRGIRIEAFRGMARDVARWQ